MQLEPERRERIDHGCAKIRSAVNRTRGTFFIGVYNGIYGWLTYLEKFIDQGSKEEVLKAVQSAQDGIEGIINQNHGYSMFMYASTAPGSRNNLNREFNTIRNLVEGDFEIAPNVLGYGHVNEILVEYPNPHISSRMKQAEQVCEALWDNNDRSMKNLTKAFEGNGYLDMKFVKRKSMASEDDISYLDLALKKLPRTRLDGKKYDPIEELKSFFEDKGLAVSSFNSDITKAEYAEAFPDYKLGCFASMIAVPYFLLTFSSLKVESFEKAYNAARRNPASDRLMISVDTLEQAKRLEETIDNSSNALSAFSQKMEKTLKRVSPPER